MHCSLIAIRTFAFTLAATSAQVSRLYVRSRTLEPIAAAVLWVVDLGHLQGCWALEDGVGDFLNASAVFVVHEIPTLCGARVAEDRLSSG